MKNIVATITLNGRINAVAPLQAGLLILLQKAPTIVPDTERPALLASLPRERAAQTYVDITSKTVLLFQQTTQKQFQLKPTGNVDEPTAAGLNGTLKRLSTFDAPVDYHVNGLGR